MLQGLAVVWLRNCGFGIGALVAAMVVGGFAAPAQAQCAVPPEMMEIAVKLPHLAARLRARERVNIVALGGASTAGTAAGSPDLAYPHRLEIALSTFYPDVPIKVVNKGVPRQTTRQMLERFPTDVTPEDPVLVIWEAGISDAVRGLNIDDFAAALQIGIDEAKARTIDIMLVDMQYSRSTATVIDFEHYLNTLHRVGELNDVYVFPRFAMMRYWSEQHTFNFDEVPTDERARLAGRVYDCIGRKLAQVIHAALK